MNKSRRELIESVANAGYEKVVSFEVIDFETLSQIKDMKTRCDLVVKKAEDLASNKIFVHACPHDEKLNPGYSFAGIYNSYKPLACRSKEENIYEGLVELFKRKTLSYADYYYGRNKLERTENIDILISKEVDDVRGSGTVYVFDEVCIGQYFASPISYFTREAIKFSSFNLKNSIEKNINRMATDAFSIINIPIDIEFVIDVHNDIFISEIRPISKKHQNNITQCQITDLEKSMVASCIINSVGEVEGKIILIEENECWKNYLDNLNGKIFVLNYSRARLEQFLNEIWKKNIDNVSLVINYDNFIIDNHELYMCFEDCGLNFITKTVNERFEDGSSVQIKSNGFSNEILKY